MEACYDCKRNDVETRECFIDGCGPVDLCRACAEQEDRELSPHQGGMYDFSAWVPGECDDCRALTAFKGRLDGYPIGVRCDTCSDAANGPIRWVCLRCFISRHTSHKFTSMGGVSELDIILVRIDEES